MAITLSTICDTRDGAEGGDKRAEGAPIASSAVSRAFTTAVLLTGGIQQAEAALMEAIRRMEPEDPSDKEFLLDCARTSIARARRHEASATDAEYATAILPGALKDILFLKPDRRYSFVLRMLLGVPAEECARLGVQDAGHHARAAAQDLARIRRAEHGFSTNQPN